MRVTLDINPELFAFAEGMAKELGYSGPMDYLNNALNLAVLLDMEHAQDLRNGEFEKMFTEDAGGGMCLADDLKDDIPF